MTKKAAINVQPLRSNDEIKEMIMAIRRGDKGSPKRKELAQRDVMLFLFGINTGLRVSDIVRLKVEDVKGKSQLLVYEGKTKKKRLVNIANIQQDLDKYISGLDGKEYLFPSQKGGGPMTPTQAYRMLQSAGQWIGRDDVGTHTMRKTFGYHFYKQTKDVAMLQNIFNHSAPSITKRYIGITQDEINAYLKNFRLG